MAVGEERKRQAELRGETAEGELEWARADEMEAQRVRAP